MRRGVVCFAAAAVLVGVAAGPASPDAKPRLTGKCPTNAQPLRVSDIPAVRRLALQLAPQGVERAGTRTIDYRGARAKVRTPSFYTGYVKSACPAAAVERVIARTADVSVAYPRISWSASLSYSVFLVARTPKGLVGWAQMH